ncbi:MAG: hypothetical protein ACPH94_02970 [Flavobacteriaceae bacterium]
MNFYWKITLLFILTLPNLVLSQGLDVENDFSIHLKTEEKTLEVSQKIRLKNNTSEALNEFFFNDWSHSYSSSKSPLAQRFAEEYDRRFYLGIKSKRGETFGLKITSDGKELAWKRIEGQLDIIKISLTKKLEIGETFEIILQYNIILPDARYTGYGRISENEYFLKNCFIQLAPYIDGKWIKNSNLDLEETSTLVSDFSMEWSIPDNLFLNSNLTQWKEVKKENRKILFLSASETKVIQFHIGDQKHKSFIIKDLIIETDLKEVSDGLLDPVSSLNQIESFVSEYLGEYPRKKMQISKYDYKKRPYYSLSLLPSFFSPFSNKFKFEIKALSVYLNHHLNEQFLVNPRENHWLTGGLHAMMIMEYVDRYHPNQKLLGKIPEKKLLKPFIKNYSLSNAPFNQGYLYSTEYIIRNNIQQSALTSKDKLIKINERVTTPSQVGHAIRYAYRFHGKEKINRAIKSQIGIIQSKEQLIQSLEKELDIPWFFEDYLKSRNSIDLKIKRLKINTDSLTLKVKQKQKGLIPFTIAQIRQDSIIQFHDIKDPKKSHGIKLKNLKSDYLAINPMIKIPEFNQLNNYKRVSKPSFKPLKFTLIKDFEDEKRNQIFFNPKTDFNAYDGLIIGTRLSNKSLERKPFVYEITPNFSSKLEEIVGSVKLVYRFYNEDSPFYLTQLRFFGSSFHYDENLRYQTLMPSLTFVKRPSDFRSNQREFFSLNLVHVNREFVTNVGLTPNYNVGNLRYLYSNKEAIRMYRNQVSFEFSDLFGKFNINIDFRHLFHDGRTFSFRFFGGKFLWNNTQNTTYFDYSLNRSSDYLFNYNYLGRSDATGIYSQQFIMSEGGFKSKFLNPNANDFIMATNLGFSLWKWVEAYTDIGIAKNKNTKSKYYYDTGLRLNLVPDYLEFYFPIQNSENFVLSDEDYLSNVRFVLTIDINNLKQLFTRKWF